MFRAPENATVTVEPMIVYEVHTSPFVPGPDRKARVGIGCAAARSFFRHMAVRPARWHAGMFLLT